MIYYTNVFKACTFWDGKMYFLFKYLRSNDCLIFMTGILIPRKTVFILRRDTDSDVSTTAMNNKQKLLDIDQTRKCRIDVSSMSIRWSLLSDRLPSAWWPVLLSKS